MRCFRLPWMRACLCVALMAARGAVAEPPPHVADPAEGFRALWCLVSTAALRWGGDSGGWMARVPVQLTASQQAFLETAGWSRHAGAKRALWVSVDEQCLRMIEGGRVLWQAPCSTAANGVGALKNSYKTPPGWHVISGRIGENSPWGQVFRSKNATSERWKPGMDVTEDLVLTRVLVLDGLEPGKNKGGNVDSFERFIYIHGTNGEAQIGKPNSHGCIRLTNDDVIALFDMVEAGTPVLITSQSEGLY